jgi:hypothetical protein
MNKWLALTSIGLLFIVAATLLLGRSTLNPASTSNQPSVSIDSPRPGQIFVAGDPVKVSWHVFGVPLSDIGKYRLNLRFLMKDKTACGYPMTVQLGTDQWGKKISGLAGSEIISAPTHGDCNGPLMKAGNDPSVHYFARAVLSIQDPAVCHRGGQAVSEQAAACSGNRSVASVDSSPFIIKQARIIGTQTTIDSGAQTITAHMKILLPNACFSYTIHSEYTNPDLFPPNSIPADVKHIPTAQNCSPTDPTVIASSDVTFPLRSKAAVDASEPESVRLALADDSSYYANIELKSGTETAITDGYMFIIPVRQ